MKPEKPRDPIVTRSELDTELRDVFLLSVLIAYFAMLFTIGLLMYYGVI